MQNYTSDQYDEMLEVFSSLDSVKHLEAKYLRDDLDTCLEIYSDFEMAFMGGLCDVIIRKNKKQTSINIPQDLAPAISAAKSHFGRDQELPLALINKLTNGPQISDTLFELHCLSFFENSLKFNVDYEPKLIDGKAPDLLITLSNGESIFVECKSEGRSGETNRRFNVGGNLVLDALKGSKLQSNAWKNGMRVEIKLEEAPTSHDIEALKNLGKSSMTLKLGDKIALNHNASLAAVSSTDPITRPSMHIKSYNIGQVSTQLIDGNAECAVYAWPGLYKRRKRTQRNLMTDARKQLAAIPDDSLGMICIQMYGAKQFIPDAHKALKRADYKKIEGVQNSVSLA
jgi:hypothetical protein